VEGANRGNGGKRREEEELKILRRMK